MRWQFLLKNLPILNVTWCCLHFSRAVKANKFIMQGTWMESLRQKFRDVRRPMVNNEKVKAMKRKYGFIKSSPSSATSREQEDCPSSAKRNLTVSVGYIILLL